MRRSAQCTGDVVDEIVSFVVPMVEWVLLMVVGVWFGGECMESEDRKAT